MVDCINQSQLLNVVWTDPGSGMVYSPTGSSDLFLILGCMTSNFLYVSFSTLYSSTLWRTDTIVVSKLSQPPSLICPLIYSAFPPSPPQVSLKSISPLNRGFTASNIEGGVLGITGGEEVK